MTEKELRKLNRAELLEMLIAQSKEVEELRAQVSELKKKLDDREICLDQAGSIAEASVLLNGVFEAAQAAAQQYLENIQMLSGRQEQICAEMELVAQEGVEKRWAEISERLEDFYNEHKGLRELLGVTGRIPIEK